MVFGGNLAYILCIINTRSNIYQICKNQWWKSSAHVFHLWWQLMVDKKSVLGVLLLLCGETGRRGDWPSEDKSNCQQPSRALTFHFQVIGEVCRGIGGCTSVLGHPWFHPSPTTPLPPTSQYKSTRSLAITEFHWLGSGQWPPTHYMVTVPRWVTSSK